LETSTDTLAREPQGDLQLLPELNGDLAMSLSPKHPHTTPFSVTDILSPIEESYRKSALEAPSSPYRSSTGGSSSAGSVQSIQHNMSVPVSNPYMHVPQLSHHGATPAFPSQYCNGSDISAYGDMRNSAAAAAGWYGATANDPRFASEYMSTNILILY
jgi:homeobox protein Nkx-2.1